MHALPSLYAAVSVDVGIEVRGREELLIVVHFSPPPLVECNSRLKCMVLFVWQRDRARLGLRGPTTLLHRGRGK
jgi:hypothetical protein